ncbi:hypothetical protein D3C72_1556170 [compost metagenome]
MRHWMSWMVAGSAALVGCAQLNIPVPDAVNVGLNRPAPGVGQAFTWNTVPGASAYQVVLSMDRVGTTPAGTTGFTADTHVSYGAIAWREGHPVKDRAYFWVLRAYDRPDPQGLLLTQSDPREIIFSDFNGFGSLQR